MYTCMISGVLAIATGIALLPKSFKAGCQFDDGQVPWFKIESAEAEETGACFLDSSDEPMADSISGALRIADEINSEMVISQLLDERDWSRFSSGKPLDDYLASTGRDPSRASVYQDLTDLATAIAAVTNTWLGPSPRQVGGAHAIALDSFADRSLVSATSEFLSAVIAQVGSIREERLAATLRAEIAELAAERLRLQAEIELLEESLSDDLTLDAFLALTTAMGDVERRLPIVVERQAALVAALPDTESAFAFETRVRAFPDAG
ncbi:hypothetical protein ABWH91_15585 [Phycisphaerales bacterium ac7]